MLKFKAWKFAEIEKDANGWAVRAEGYSKLDERWVMFSLIHVPTQHQAKFLAGRISKLIQDRCNSGE